MKIPLLLFVFFVSSGLAFGQNLNVKAIACHAHGTATPEQAAKLGEKALPELRRLANRPECRPLAVIYIGILGNAGDSKWLTEMLDKATRITNITGNPHVGDADVLTQALGILANRGYKHGLPVLRRIIKRYCSRTDADFSLTYSALVGLALAGQAEDDLLLREIAVRCANGDKDTEALIASCRKDWEVSKNGSWKDVFKTSARIGGPGAFQF